jgi:hypothetical protein
MKKLHRTRAANRIQMILKKLSYICPSALRMAWKISFEDIFVVSRTFLDLPAKGQPSAI